MGADVYVYIGIQTVQTFTLPYSHFTTYTLTFIHKCMFFSLRMIFSHMHDIMHTEFISKTIRPPGLINWLSASSYMLTAVAGRGW